MKAAAAAVAAEGRRRLRGCRCSSKKAAAMVLQVSSSPPLKTRQQRCCSSPGRRRRRLRGDLSSECILLGQRCAGKPAGGAAEATEADAPAEGGRVLTKPTPSPSPKASEASRAAPSTKILYLSFSFLPRPLSCVLCFDRVIY